MAVCNPYVDYDPPYWVLGYAEGELECVAGAYGSRGFAGWSYTEEELEELARGDRRKRIKQQIKELERQLAIERAWAEMEDRQRYEALTGEIADLERRKQALKT